jgi:hypothetical protein
LIDDHDRPHIDDFGQCGDMPLNMTIGIGIIVYYAPEVLKREEYGLPADVFAFGLVVYELLIGSRGFIGTEKQIGMPILGNRHHTIPSAVPESAQQLIKACSGNNLAQTPDFQGIVSSLKAIECEVLPGVNTVTVMRYIAEIEAKEKDCDDPLILLLEVITV